MKKLFTGIFLVIFALFTVNLPAISDDKAASYPEDVNSQEIAEDEYTQEIDIEKIDRKSTRLNYSHESESRMKA